MKKKGRCRPTVWRARNLLIDSNHGLFLRLAKGSWNLPGEVSAVIVSTENLKVFQLAVSGKDSRRDAPGGTTQRLGVGQKTYDPWAWRHGEGWGLEFLNIVNEQKNRLMINYGKNG